ncbi:MAG TPA: BrnA antitoxin family protein, partial [Xanthobacteraceae bacterium]|nr:BrnA antitoxin family protein [Xanthobacteraceae bacterium]
GVGARPFGSFLLGKHQGMSAKSTRKRTRIVRYESLDDIPVKPLNRKLIAMSDEEAERRAAADPDAGVIPPGFWDNATVYMPQSKQQITLRLDPDVISWFKRTGKGYQSRMGAVLRSYVDAKRKRSA